MGKNMTSLAKERLSTISPFRRVRQLGVNQVSSPNLTATESQKATKEVGLESINKPDYGLFFDLRKTIDWYQALKKEREPKEAWAIARRVLIEDLYAQAWETVDTREPCSYEYRLVKVGDETRMIHASDEHNSKDILDGVDKRVRRGLEYQQLVNVKQKVSAAAEDTTLFVVSPKLDRTKESDKDCYYPDTFLTVFFKKGDQVVTRQFKSEFLNTEQSGELINQIPGGDRPIKNKTDLDRMLVTVGEAAGWIENEDINQMIERVSGVKMGRSADMQRIKKLSEFAGEVMVMALDQGMWLDQLEELHFKLLLTIVEGQPSDRVKRDNQGRIYLEAGCSFISGRGRSNTLSSLMSRESENEVKCPHCNFVNTCQKWGEKCIQCKEVMDNKAQS